MWFFIYHIEHITHFLTANYHNGQIGNATIVLKTRQCREAAVCPGVPACVRPCALPMLTKMAHAQAPRAPAMGKEGKVSGKGSISAKAEKGGPVQRGARLAVSGLKQGIG
jgi:hypothetical protein